MGGLQEKANCPKSLPALPLNLTHYLTLPLAAGKNSKNTVPKKYDQKILYLLTSMVIFAYCSVLNNRPLLIIIRGEFQAIETPYSAEQYPCSISKLIKSGIKDTKPKFEQSRTKTVDFRRN